MYSPLPNCLSERASLGAEKSDLNDCISLQDAISKDFWAEIRGICGESILRKNRAYDWLEKGNHSKTVDNENI